MATKGSVTHWISQIKAGDEAAAQQELFGRYYKRLVGLARRKLGHLPRRAVDEEDVVLSALCSFFVGARQGRFPDLRDRNNLWPLLVKITACKAINEQHRQLAAKRGGGKVGGESRFVRRGHEEEARGIEQFVGDEPSPSLINEMAEQCRELFSLLDNESLRQVAQRKLENYTNREIAAELGVTERTVERKLRLIRKLWSKARAEGAAGAKNSGRKR